MGLGSYPCDNELSLQMLRMHGTVYANYDVEHSDLLLAFSVRFNDRVTGKLEAFASRAKIVHIDIESAEIGKNKSPHVSLCGVVQQALQGMNKLNEQKQKFPLSFKTFGEVIPPQYAIQKYITKAVVIIRRSQSFGLQTSCCDWSLCCQPDAIVVDNDGDGNFIMNVQKLATIHVENLPVKILILNNQHLGMPAKGKEIFPNMLQFAAACGIPAARRSYSKMLDTPGPFLLNVICPHQEHVLPMIPSGCTFNVIIEGDGRTKS
ncbi:hypothetical protein HID58_081730 [Brassica napus]|uniref:Thiamine pyrophosphate enzyme TPP-binding domain-containing protein n=2 Tax=Brassica TaxID=3705 RepID=A0A3P6FWB2_BRAOL|nr:hypothetical protein HID58_081730 [Brassica napus]CAF2110407.1 unnamed protein product [Brassica napus]VDD56760.1 unnamed protein product [Brassica oleracea]